MWSFVLPHNRGLPVKKVIKRPSGFASFLKLSVVLVFNGSCLHCYVM